MNSESNTANATEEHSDKQVERTEEAIETVKRYAIGSMTVGLIQVPLLDVVALTGIQLTMLHNIAEQYEVPFSENLVKPLVSSLLGSTLSLTVAMSVASLLKSVPLIGQVSGTISVMVMGGGATYAVGKIFVQHFESGGTFSDFDPEKAKEQFKNLYEEGKDFALRQKNPPKSE